MTAPSANRWCTIQQRVVLLSFAAIIYTKFLRARQVPPRNVSALHNISVETGTENRVETRADDTRCPFFFLQDVGAVHMGRHGGHRHDGFLCFHVKKLPPELFSEYHLYVHSEIRAWGGVILLCVCVSATMMCEAIL